MKKLILASKSPRRHEILTLAGLDHEIIVSNADESVPEGATPAEAVREISRRKAAAVLDCLSEKEESLDNVVIIAADTVVDVDGEVLGKPSDNDDAVRMLKMLSGRRHLVHTGITVTDGTGTVSEYVTTGVVMREIGEKEIKAYVSEGNVLDKAGAYAVQGKAGAFVSSLDGDFFNVVGLPLCRTCEILSDFGIELFEKD